MRATNPIGVFDSGVGGLSILHHIRLELPQEDFIYIADTAHIPYGSKSEASVTQRSITLTQFFLRQDVKAIVIACNTATAAAIATLRSLHSLPIVGVEPAVKPAITMTKSGIIGVLATNGTLASAKFGHLIERFGKSVELIVQPCPGLVEQVEKAELSGVVTRTLIEHYLTPLLKRGADTLVLGCTHYPFLKPLIEDIVGQGIAIIDPGFAVSQQLRHRLKLEGLLTEKDTPGEEQFWTSGDPEAIQQAIARLWSQGIKLKRLPEPYTGISTTSNDPNPSPSLLVKGLEFQRFPTY
jgi:glutamate racemase